MSIGFLRKLLRVLRISGDLWRGELLSNQMDYILDSLKS
jgi:hypothetical protein